MKTRTQQVIRLREIEFLTFGEIGKKLGFTKQRAQYLYANRDKIRKQSSGRPLLIDKDEAKKIRELAESLSIKDIAIRKGFCENTISHVIHKTGGYAENRRH
jgi:hypothetical protein